MLEQVLKALVLADKVPYLESPPGWGKSAVVKALARELNAEAVIEYLGQRAGNEIHGLSVVAKEPLVIDGRPFPSVEQAPPAWALHAVRSESWIILFFDEINQLSPQDFGVTMSILTERKVGGVSLDRERIALIGAGNPPAVSAGGWRIPLPAVRRLVVIPLEISAAAFASPDCFVTNWGAPLRPIKKFGHELDMETRVRARTKVAAWVHANPDVFNLPKDLAVAYGGFVCPATCEDASDIMASVEQHVPAQFRADALQMGLRGCLGQAGADALLTFLDHIDVPDSREVLDDPTRFFASAEVPSADKLYFFLLSLVEEMRLRNRAAKDKPGSKVLLAKAQASWENGLKVAAHLHEHEASTDLLCMLVGNFQLPELRPKDVKAPEIVDKLAPMVATMRAAGVSWVRLGDRASTS